LVKKIIFLLVVMSGSSHAAAPDPCLIFFVPGAFSSASKAALYLKPQDYFSQYKKFFVEKGCAFGEAQFPADGTIEERGLFLKDQASRFALNNKGKLILVAHSQGGLDARFAIKTLKLDSISALVTIGTPHLGSPVADWVVEQGESESFIYWVSRVLFNYDFKLLRFAGELRSDFLKKHADKFQAVPAVKYASASGLCLTDCHRSLKLLDWWIKVGPGDGFTPVKNQSFGHDLGQYDLDHISEVGVELSKNAERQRLLETVWKFLVAGLQS